MKRFFVFSIALLAACKSNPPKPAEGTIPVTVATAQQKDMPVQIRAVGIVQPLQTVAVRALVSGQLTKVWFREGDEVRMETNRMGDCIGGLTLFVTPVVYLLMEKLRRHKTASAMAPALTPQPKAI